MSEETEQPESNPAASTERPDGFVPKEALHEAREQNKQLREETRSLKEVVQRMEGTFQQFLTKANDKPSTPAPDYAQDPLGYFQHENAELKKNLATINEKLDKTGKSSEQQEQVQRIAGALQSAEAEFRTTAPDYDEAAKYLKGVRRADLMDLGMPAEQVEGVLNQEILGLTQTALSKGKSPAEAAYKMAKRYGYKPKEKDTTLETIANGMDASKSAGGGGGGSPSALQDLGKLSNDQFDAIINDPVKWNKLMRGQSV